MTQSPESVVTGVKHPSLETQTIRCSLRILQVLKWFHSYEAQKMPLLCHDIHYCFCFFITPSSFIPPKGKAKPYLQFQDRPSSWRRCQKGTVTYLLQLFREFTNSQRPSLQFFHCGNLGRYVKNLPTATSIEGATLSNLNATRRRYC